MIFSSYSFIFIFLPITLAGFAALRRFCGLAACKWWLIAASLVFYAQGSLSFVPLLAGTVVVNFFLIQAIGRLDPKGAAAKLALGASIAENLGLLFYFKYLNFFLGTVNMAAGTDFVLHKIILPIGISFYTFQILACAIDVYRRESKVESFLDFAAFVTFFPQLIVGPIIRFNGMAPQLGEGLGRPTAERVMLGLLLFSIGCAKKVIIADPLIGHAQEFYATFTDKSMAGFFEGWSGVLSYTFAYYFDFSGYIDMALGLGLFFNVSLPQNFNSPYKARNFADFWRRWNITVSQFFNDYIFRRIFRFGDRTPKLVLATFVTFLVSGVWHGAGWNFIFWGLANGALVCAANIMTLHRKSLPFPLAWALTFTFVLLVRVLFDCNGMTQAMTVYRTILDFRPLFTDAGAFLAEGLHFVKNNVQTCLLITAGAGICFFAPNTGEVSRNFSPRWYYAAFAGVILTISGFLMREVSNFLYFQF